jgi:hypothetical protein
VSEYHVKATRHCQRGRDLVGWASLNIS